MSSINLAQALDLSSMATRVQKEAQEEAVKKMTSIPAERFGIENRGKIAKNYFADIVVIDRDEIEDMATTADPYQYSKGVDFVLVNGQVVVADGKHTGATAGEIIRR